MTLKAKEIKAGWFLAKIITPCIIKVGATVALRDTGNGHYLVCMSNGHLVTTMTLWVRSENFERLPVPQPTAQDYQLTPLEKAVWARHNQGGVGFHTIATEFNRTETAIAAAWSRAHNKLNK